MISRRWIDLSWFSPAPAARLGVVRVLTGGFALGYVWGRAPYLGSYAGFSREQFQPIGVASLLSGPLPAWLVWALVGLTALLAVPFMLGWRFRWVAPPFALLLLWTLTYRNSWGMIFHTENLMVLHVFVLAAARSADGWSLDARRRPTPAAESMAYGWPLRLMAAIAAATYLMAGIAKLRSAGLDWAGGEVLRNYVAVGTLHKVLLGGTYSPVTAHLVSQEWLFAALAIFTLLLELGAPLTLLSPRLAPVWVVSALGFHAGVLLLMAIFFPYPGLGFAFAAFFEVERPAEWIKVRLGRFWKSRGGGRGAGDIAG